jgi:hypothetical protein
MNESSQELLARHTFPKPTALPSFRRAHDKTTAEPSAWERERGNDSLIEAANPSGLFPGRTFVRRYQMPHAM